MRLRRLMLARYGKFTDRTIDFGEAVDGTPDLHVVYGPNESGKSTLLSGFLDLLFGIEMQSRYGFLHSYDTMRVGGCLELPSGLKELVRIKKPQPTLRDASNQPVAQTFLTGELAGWTELPTGRCSRSTTRLSSLEATAFWPATVSWASCCSPPAQDWQS